MMTTPPHMDIDFTCLKKNLSDRPYTVQIHNFKSAKLTRYNRRHCVRSMHIRMFTSTVNNNYITKSRRHYKFPIEQNMCIKLKSNWLFNQFYISLIPKQLNTCAFMSLIVCQYCGRLKIINAAYFFFYYTYVMCVCMYT